MRDERTDRQIDTQTGTLIAIIRTPYWGEVTRPIGILMKIAIQCIIIASFTTTSLPNTATLTEVLIAITYAMLWRVYCLIIIIIIIIIIIKKIKKIIIIIIIIIIITTITSGQRILTKGRIAGDVFFQVDNIM